MCKVNNPYRDEIVDDRLELIAEKTIKDVKFLEYILHPTEVYSCPTCHSNNIIKYGKVTRVLKMKIYSSS